MKRVLLDVNVVLDVLFDRKPFSDTSSAVWEAVAKRLPDGVTAAPHSPRM